MKFTPSLTRRIALVFLAMHLAVLLLGVVVMRPLFLESEDGDVSGPAIAAQLVADSLVSHGSGGRTIVPSGALVHLMRDAPELWAIVDDGRERLRLGRVPAGAERVLAVLPRDAFAAQFRVPGQRTPVSDAALVRFERGGISLGVVAGGVDPGAIGFWRWLHYLFASRGLLALLCLAAVAVPAVLLAAPIALRRLRPLIAAARAIDPAHPERRLPIAITPRELRPLVGAFNATLDGLAGELERRRRFIADVSHELRTPLAILALHVDALPQGPGRSELLRLQFRLTHMVGQMLDAQRLAIAPLVAATVDLRSLASGVVAEFAPLAIREGYSVALTGDAGPIPVGVEPHAIGRALSNLLGNAVAHGGGSGQIEVRVNRNGTIDVIDEGPGVLPEARSRIFLPFSRERWDRDGCGLGLHLVREIMRAHGGEVDVVDSPRGHFRLSFRVDAPQAA